jgi:5-bromo-4-chloroindolyl phosphate hydrolysis protein
MSKLLPIEERVNEIVKDGMRKLNEIRQQSMHIKNNSVAFKIKDICKVGVEIFDVLKKNPNDVRRAKQFINYYIDATLNIVKRYVELSRKKNPDDEVTKSLEEVENTLDSIKETYEKQLANLYEDDLLDLNTEISLLKKTMKLQK